MGTAVATGGEDPRVEIARAAALHYEDRLTELRHDWLLYPPGSETQVRIIRAIRLLERAQEAEAVDPEPVG